MLIQSTYVFRLLGCKTHLHTAASVGHDREAQADALSTHLQQVAVAVQNRFIPIFLVPDAAQYGNEQRHKQLQKHRRRRHEPSVIRASPPVPDHMQQRELLADRTQQLNATSKPMSAGQPPQAEPNMLMVVVYGLGNAAMNIWYWLPTQEEMLLWLSQYMPFADALIMDYYRLKLGSLPNTVVVHEVPVDPLDQALRDAWVHR